jgi:pimeloyl-ACP methyl ester carboxylesterase
MSPEVTPALRVAGRGLLAAGALAAGAALGAIAERSLLRASGAPGLGDEPADFGTIHGDVRVVEASDGTSLHVEIDEIDEEGDVAGGALTVVFAHGYALNLDSWHYQRQALRGRARLVLYDQRSHGRSQRADFDTHHVDQLGSDLGAVIDAVAPTGPLMLVGHSMGGMTIMALAAQRPELFDERVYGVALIATTAGGLSSGQLGLPPGVGPMLHRIAPSVAAAIARRKGVVDKLRWSHSDLGLLLTRLYSFGSTATDQASRFVASMVSATPIDVVAEFLPALQEHDKRAVLGVFQGVELLVIVGDSDRLTPQEQSAEIVRHVPGAEYVIVADSGHMLTLEKHEEVDAHLVALLERVRRDIAAEASDGAA